MMKRFLKPFLIITTLSLILAMTAVFASKVDATTILDSTVSFETSEGFAASTSYQGTVTGGNTGKQWTFYYGTPSTSKKISGEQSAALRLYTSENYGYLQMEYDIKGIQTVSYNASAQTSNSAKILINTYYSTDAGTSWVIVDSKKEIASSATSYSFNLPDSLNESNVRIKFEIDSTSTRPTKSYAQLTIDDVSVYVYSNLTNLETPTASLLGNTVTVSSEMGTNRMAVGLFEAEDSIEPLVEYTASDSTNTYTINETAQGTYYVRVKLTDPSETYLDSDYTDSLGTITISEITEKSVSEMMEVEPMEDAPFTYYQVSGMVGEIIDTSKSTFYIIDKNDPTKTMLVYDMKNSEGSSYSMKGLNIEEGDDITLNATSTFNKDTLVLKGQYVSSSANYLGRFSMSDLEASLKLTYDIKGYETTSRYEKITDASQIKNGSKIVICASQYQAMMSTTTGGASGTSYMQSDAALLSLDKQIYVGDPVSFDVEIVDGSYYLKNGSNYLGFLKSDSKSVMVLDEKATENAVYSWNITSADGVISISSTNEEYGRLQYNSSNPRFTCYTSNQKSIDIYLYQEKEVPVYENIKASIKFRLSATTELYSNIRNQFPDVTYSFSNEIAVKTENYSGSGFYLFAEFDDITNLDEVYSGSFIMTSSSDTYSTKSISFSCKELLQEYLSNYSEDESVKAVIELIYSVLL